MIHVVKLVEFKFDRTRYHFTLNREVYVLTSQGDISISPVIDKSVSYIEN